MADPVIVQIAPPTAPVVVELPAQQGPAGPQGVSGAPGTQVRFGAGAPSNSTGVDGDIWWDTTNHRVYQRVSSAYVQREAIASGSGFDAHYQHSQGVPASVWTVAHNLGKRPSVTVLDSAGDEVEGDVEHVDVNNLIITFSAPFAGLAVCN